MGFEDYSEKLTVMNDYNFIKALLESNRSIRRFDEDRAIYKSDLDKLIELTRYCASGRNMQPLRYIRVTDDDERKLLFPILAWAGYLEDWSGPVEGERPTAYLVQCLDTRYGKQCLCDDGLQLQAITLGARALGIGCCIIKSFNLPKLRELFHIDGSLLPLYVVALGYPVERVIIESTDGSADADIKYYRTPDGVHHVPKRPLEELILR